MKERAVTPARTAVAVAVAWAIATFYISVRNPVFYNGDQFGFIRRAEALDFSSRLTFVSGFYPFGYPLALRTVAHLIGDYARAGQLLSWVAGTAGLVVLYRLMSRLSAAAGLLALVICATNPTYIRFSTTGGTDVPAAALMLAATWLLVRESRPSVRGMAVAGAVLGLAYMTRYTALTILPAMLLWPWLESGPSWRRQRLGLCAALGGGFLLTAAPQLVMSWLVRGNPLFNQQVQNIHFGMYGNQNWGLNIAASGRVTSLGALVADDPMRFVHHWYGTFQSLFRLELLQFPVGLVAVAGWLLMLRRPQSRRIGILLSLEFLCFALAVSMAFVNLRLLLYLTMLAAAFAAAALVRLLPRDAALAGRQLPVRTIASTALSFWLAWEYVKPLVRQPMPPRAAEIIAVSQAITKAGVPARQVLSLGFDYYDVASSTKDQYAISWYEPAFDGYRSFADVASQMHRAGQTHLIVDATSPVVVRGLAAFWTTGRAELEQHFDQVAVVNGVRIYRLKT